MRKVMVLAVLLAACTDGSTVEPIYVEDACPTGKGETWLEITEPAPDVAEVLVPVLNFATPGESYTAEDGGSTWSTWARRYEGRLGTYGKLDQDAPVCSWWYAVESR